MIRFEARIWRDVPGGGMVPIMSVFHVAEDPATADTPAQPAQKAVDGQTPPPEGGGNPPEPLRASEGSPEVDALRAKVAALHRRVTNWRELHQTMRNERDQAKRLADERGACLDKIAAAVRGAGYYAGPGTEDADVERLIEGLELLRGGRGIQLVEMGFAPTPLPEPDESRESLLNARNALQAEVGRLQGEIEVMQAAHRRLLASLTFRDARPVRKARRKIVEAALAWQARIVSDPRNWADDGDFALIEAVAEYRRAKGDTA